MNKKWKASVTGMSCEHCVQRVSSALSEVDGVAAVHVKLKTGVVRVKYDDTKAQPEQLTAAIVAAGYQVIAPS